MKLSAPSTQTQKQADTSRINYFIFQLKGMKKNIELMQKNSLLNTALKNLCMKKIQAEIKELIKLIKITRK